MRTRNARSQNRKKMSKRERPSDVENDDDEVADLASKKQKQDPRLLRCIEIEERASALALWNVKKKARIQFTLTLFEIDPASGHREELSAFSKTVALTDRVYHTAKIPPLHDGHFYSMSLSACLLFSGASTRVHKWHSTLTQFISKTAAIEVPIGDKADDEEFSRWTVEINREGHELLFAHYESSARRLIAGFRDEFLELDSARVLAIVLAEAALNKPDQFVNQ